MFRATLVYDHIWGGSKFRDFSSKLSIWARKISNSNCVRVASFYIGISALYVTRNGRENARRDRRKKEMRYTGLMSIFSGPNSGLNHTFFTKRPPPGCERFPHCRLEFANLPAHTHTALILDVAYG